ATALGSTNLVTSTACNGSPGLGVNTSLIPHKRACVYWIYTPVSPSDLRIRSLEKCMRLDREAGC
ncbi:hypothetical protein SARC_14951, partial [Sphaeroforma arctica JP610]